MIRLQDCVWYDRSNRINGYNSGFSVTRNSVTVRETVFGNGLVCIVTYWNALYIAIAELSTQIALFDIECIFNK